MSFENLEKKLREELRKVGLPEDLQLKIELFEEIRKSIEGD